MIEKYGDLRCPSRFYVGMTRGRDENRALVVTEEPDIAEAIGILEAAIAIDRANIPATTHRRTLAEAVPRSVPRPRVQIPEWFDELRATAEEKRRDARQALDERNAERSAEEQWAAVAPHRLPAAESANDPFKEQIVAAKHVVSESQSALWNAEYELRKSGRVRRRSARRDVEAATDVLAAANAGLARAEELASPTREPLDGLRTIINDHRQSDSTRRILDHWDDLNGAADRAGDVCRALDRWKNWADGRQVDNSDLVEAAHVRLQGPSVLGAEELGRALAGELRVGGVEVLEPGSRWPSIEFGIEV